MVVWSGLLFMGMPMGTLLAQGRGRGKMTVVDFFLRPKFITMIILAVLALILLKTRKMTKPLKVSLLLSAVFFFGIAGNIAAPFFAGYAMHPSPICAFFKAMLYGFRVPMIVTASVILLLTLLGPKLFCGWVCPVGALQELLAMCSKSFGWKRWKVPFRISNSVRILMLVLFVFLSGTAVLHTFVKGEKVALSFYDWLNAFHGFEFEWLSSFWGNLIHYLPMVLTIAFGFLVYRPYCHFICPIGLITNWLEPVALFRINRKRNKCNDCMGCIAKTPCQAVPEILKGAAVRPDCFSCGDCLDSCPTDAFTLDRSTFEP